MRVRIPASAIGVVPILVFLVCFPTHASPSQAVDPVHSPPFPGPRMIPRNGGHNHDAHSSHGQPLLVLNETEIAFKHQLIPPSYYTFDWEGEGDSSAQRHQGLMMMHIVCMVLAFFGALPVAIILRSLKHPAHGASMIAFYGLAGVGSSCAGLYTKMTPNLYEGSVHGTQSRLILFLATCLSLGDIIAGLSRLVSFLKSDRRSVKLFWRYVILNQEDNKATERGGPEYTNLMAEELEGSKLADMSDAIPSEPSDDNTDDWANEAHRRHRRGFSTASDRTLACSNSTDTLNDSSGEPRTAKKWLGRAGQVLTLILERALVIGGFAMFLTGVVVYTGGCRQNWINGCLAHLIKGGIFWCYGLLTFARFLGAYADLGWAWNRAPSSRRSTFSAEWTESAVIFLYGITNTWMERFGANPGDPFTTKQIQHISIAVMFWFAGLLGMGIESKTIRRWLSSSSLSRSNPSGIPRETIREPPSYLASFNPFPALVIGVTGSAMAAHVQTYVFQVEIHKLWGNLLVAFSVLRCLTYFFLWLGPPRSILPSRPPTEALSSFFLACGGLVFIFSVEEVTIAAMRRGRDDVMMFLNVAVAITCLAFCWILSMVTLKGYLKSRSYTVTYRSSDDTALA